HVQLSYERSFLLPFRQLPSASPEIDKTQIVNQKLDTPSGLFTLWTVGGSFAVLTDDHFGYGRRRPSRGRIEASKTPLTINHTSDVHRQAKARGISKRAVRVHITSTNAEANGIISW
ncbi:hypothetical protein CABS01_16902, partial [Colletotrichum abscissum]|uniref:uncharacterized protein n=1 Tax=Colletotrichum abscissum TaxID=1671311 RepID=UPI0027D4F68B